MLVMSEKHLMFCNLIAWKEGNDYVFEDGSKAYTFLDNDERFNNYTLMPDWVVEGLTDTPFNRFGFRSNKIHVQALGVFTRKEFEQEIVKYKVVKLQEYIGKTIRLLDGRDVKITRLKGYKFIVDIKVRQSKGWIHVKDVLDNRYVLYSFGMETVAYTGEICERIEDDCNNAYFTYVKLNGEVVQKSIHFLFKNCGCGGNPDNITVITSAYMYENRLFYYRGLRKCRIVGDLLASNKTFETEFLDNGEKSRHSAIVLFKYLEENRIVKGRFVDAEIVDIYHIPNTRLTYYTLRFCDGSTTDLERAYVKNGTLCHSDVIDACKGTVIKILGYWYDDGKWYVRSILGTTAREDFKGRVDEFEHFLETCIGKTYESIDGYKYTIDSFIMKYKVRRLRIVFDNGRVKEVNAQDIFNGNIKSYNDNEIITSKYKDWTDSTMGLRFRVIRYVNRAKYEVEFENGDRVIVGKERLLNHNIYPSIIEWVRGYGKYIGTYKGYFILSAYFDFEKDLYIMLTRDRDILYVTRDGSLKKTIKHDEE